MIVAYVSGHGFGHLTRTSEVLRLVHQLDPEQALAVVSSAPAPLFRGAVGERLAVRSDECDVGLVQRGALMIDEAASLARWRAFVADWDAHVRREAEWLRAQHADLVLGDVPPLAFAAAEAAGLPSVALANFSWDWVFRHYAARHPGMNEAAEWAAAAYRHAQLLLRLPFAGDLSVFQRIEDVPLIARRSALEPGEVRRRLGIDDRRPLVLWSFGGHGLPGFAPSVLSALSDFRFVMTDVAAPPPPNVLSLDERRLAPAGLRYTDLVAAADVVISKPGYGIVTDALSGRTPLVYTERGDFPEYPILVRDMAAYLPAVFVSNEDLLAGRVREAIDAALRQPWPPTPPLDGAEVVARRLLGLVGRPPGRARASR